MSQAVNFYVTNITGTGAISSAFNPGVAFSISQITLHANAAISGGALTVTVNSPVAVCDAVIVNQSTDGLADLAYIPTLPLYFGVGETATIGHTNADGKTLGIRVVYVREE